MFSAITKSLIRTRRRALLTNRSEFEIENGCNRVNLGVVEMKEIEHVNFLKNASEFWCQFSDIIIYYLTFEALGLRA